MWKVMLDVSFKKKKIEINFHVLCEFWIGSIPPEIIRQPFSDNSRGHRS